MRLFRRSSNQQGGIAGIFGISVHYLRIWINEFDNRPKSKRMVRIIGSIIVVMSLFMLLQFYLTNDPFVEREFQLGSSSIYMYINYPTTILSAQREFLLRFKVIAQDSTNASFEPIAIAIRSNSPSSIAFNPTLLPEFVYQNNTFNPEMQEITLTIDERTQLPDQVDFEVIVFINQQEIVREPFSIIIDREARRLRQLTDGQNSFGAIILGIIGFTLTWLDKILKWFKP